MVVAHNTEHNARTKDIKISQDVTFDTMLLSETTYEGLRNSGFYKPSPIQLHGIPLGKCGFDLLLEAKSGTGKTAVFSVIALEKIVLGKGLQTLILAPTREIASQIRDVIKEIGAYYNGLGVEVVMGGLPLQEDIAKFKKGKHVHVLVGSPGRVRHLIQDNYVDTSAIRLIVFDEADKLMEKSFQADINYIYSTLPQQKQVIMSSATYPDTCKDFIHKYVNNAQHIKPDSTSVLLGIEQKITIVNRNINIVAQTNIRYEELLKIMSKKQFKQCLIFCNYQARVAELHKMLVKDKWPSEQLYGLQEQTERLDALKTLQEFKCRILISTDLAARGIDASNVDLVVNFEPPYEWQTYLHRIGRAGRYGSYGSAITILAKGNEEIKFRSMLQSMKNSLNISYLWSNEKFSFETSVPMPRTQDILLSDKKEIKIEENNNNKTEVINSFLKKDVLDSLWDDMAGPKQKETQIDDFESMMRSFNTTQETEIDSFENLLQGYDDFTSDLESISMYNCLKIEDACGYNREPIHDKVENIGNTLICVKELNQNQDNNANLGTVKTEKVTEQVQNLQEITNASFIEPDVCEEVAENLEMLRLGLPTSFGKKKDTQKKKREKPKVQNNITKSADELVQKVPKSKELKLTDKSNNKMDNNSTTNSAFRSVKKSVCYEIEQNSTRNSVEPCYEYEYRSSQYQIPEHKHNPTFKKSCTHEKSKLLKKQPNNSYKNNLRYNKQCDSLRSVSDIEYLSDEHNYFKVNKNYRQWYNQLKLRTQQLEQIFYLQEISKM